LVKKLKKIRNLKIPVVGVTCGIRASDLSCFPRGYD
jgi:hypothetical protein